MDVELVLDDESMIIGYLSQTPGWLVVQGPVALSRQMLVGLRSPQLVRTIILDNEHTEQFKYQSTLW